MIDTAHLRRLLAALDAPNPDGLDPIPADVGDLLDQLPAALDELDRLQQFSPEATGSDVDHLVGVDLTAGRVDLSGVPMLSPAQP